MANAFKTSEINFRPNSVQEELTLGKTYDKLKSAQAPQEERKKKVRESIPPWMVQPDDKTLNWEYKREEKLIDLRQHPTYQFCMLVTSFTNEKMDKYWISPSETQAEHSGVKDIGTTTVGAKIRIDAKQSVNRANQTFHKYYVDTPWLDGIIYLSPAMYGHIEEAYVAISQKHEHLSKVPLAAFTNTPRVRTMFAKLVALCIRASDFLSQKRYNLDSTYSRINIEKRRMMHYWKNVKYIDGTLFYFHMDGRRLDYHIPQGVNPNQISGGLTSNMFKASMSLQENMKRY